MLGKQAMDKGGALGAVRDAAPWRISALVAVSLVIHLLLFTPLGSVLGLLALLVRSTEAPTDFKPITEIPISLIEDTTDEGSQGATKDREVAEAVDELTHDIPQFSPQSSKSSTSGRTPPPTPKPAPSVHEKPPKPVKSVDAGSPKPKPSPSKLRKKRHRAVGDAGATRRADAGAVKAKKDKDIADPATLVGSAAKLNDANANVRLLIFTDRIRGQALGQRIGALLGALPQWQSFLSGSGIDAVRDVDRIYITGPQFRRSDEVMALLEYNVPQSRVHAAVETLVERSPDGRWLDTPFPVAIARADRADRLFALPRRKLVIVAPLGAQGSVVRDGPKVQFPEPKGDEAVVAYVNNPWRVFMGSNLSLPRSIRWLKLQATPQADGGVAIEVLAKDGNARVAQKDAPAVADQINDLTQLGGIGAVLAGFGFTPFIDRVELHAEGALIRGELRMTSDQLRRVLGFVETWAEARSGATRSSASPAPSASSPIGSSKPGRGGGTR